MRKIIAARDFPTLPWQGDRRTRNQRGEEKAQACVAWAVRFNDSNAPVIRSGNRDARRCLHWQSCRQCSERQRACTRSISAAIGEAPSRASYRASVSGENGIVFTSAQSKIRAHGIARRCAQCVPESRKAEALVISHHQVADKDASPPPPAPVPPGMPSTRRFAMSDV